MQLSENLTQDLANWYRQQQAAHPNMDAPELWATNVTDQQRLARNTMINRWMAEKQQVIRDEIDGRLEAPSLVDVSKPTVVSEADVRGSYHPHAVAAPTGSPALGNPEAAAAIIEAGKRSLSDEKDAAQAGRNNSMQGSADVQEDVHRDHNRGFFHDPNLRR